jgi:thiamine biosynthesis lipoprotein
MGTVVTIDVFGPEPADGSRAPAVERAFDWFLGIETMCTRFDAASELMQLSRQVGVAVPVSSLLFEVLQFALAVSRASAGAFDPTVGHLVAAHGFNREHRTGRLVTAPIVSERVSYRDVILDARSRTVTLQRPLVLDLGAVAKGLAIDMAARELQPFRNFAIDAGGDLYLGGHGSGGGPWHVGLRHPRADGVLIASVRVSDMAVCTSGDYERTSVTPGRAQHHIIDPRTGASSAGVASVTVLAPTAMVADALATTACVLGPRDGIAFLEAQGVHGFMVTTGLTTHATAHFPA